MKFLCAGPGMKNKSSMFQAFSIRAISAAIVMDHPIIEAISEKIFTNPLT